MLFSEAFPRNEKLENFASLQKRDTIMLELSYLSGLIRVKVQKTNRASLFISALAESQYDTCIYNISSDCDDHPSG